MVATGKVAMNFRGAVNEVFQRPVTKSSLAQDHATLKLILKDRSVWYLDIGMINNALKGRTISNLSSDEIVTPENKMPEGWIRSNRQ
jgi:hypothetical protein